MIAGLGVVVSGLFYIYYISPTEIDRDPKTLCPEVLAEIPHHEVLLFERNRRIRQETGKFIPLSPNTAIQIQRKISRNLNSVPKNSLVEIYEVNYTSVRSETQEEYRPLARLCHPGDGSDIPELTGNPRLAKQRYEKMFREPVEKLLKEVSTWSPDHQFSLVDSLGGVSRLVLGNEELAHATKALTVVSDFIVPENFTSRGAIVTNFRDVGNSSVLGDFDAYAKAGGIRFNFHEASVRLLINRERYVTIPDIQGPKHTLWWERFFDAQNAVLEEVEQVGEW